MKDFLENKLQNNLNKLIAFLEVTNTLRKLK